MAGMHAPLARLARPAPGSFPVADDACLPLSAISLRAATRVAPRVEPARPPMVGLWVAAAGPPFHYGTEPS